MAEFPTVARNLHRSCPRDDRVGNWRAGFQGTQAHSDAARILIPDVEYLIVLGECQAV